jgi:hypothetical protein
LIEQKVRTVDAAVKETAKLVGLSEPEISRMREY